MGACQYCLESEAIACVTPDNGLNMVVKATDCPCFISSTEKSTVINDQNQKIRGLAVYGR
jgi:hypothetical protein